MLRRAIRMMFLTVLLMTPALASAQESYTTLLLPVSPSSVIGQNGAEWLTELTLANNASDPINLFCFVGTCEPIEGRAVIRYTSPPRQTILPGLMHVPDSQARRLSAALRSRNTTPNSEERDFVSEIPVVREEEFRSSVIEILSVPIEANYRHQLRIYDAAAGEGKRVRVRIYGMTIAGTPTSNALFDTILVLNTRRGTASPHALPDEPSWIALPNFSDLPDVRNFRDVHIRIEALDPGMQLWAFATATNNTTQRFAVYTP